MSTFLYISLDTNVPELNPNGEDHPRMAWFQKELDAAAHELRVRLLTAFHSYAPADIDDYRNDDAQAVQLLANLPPTNHFNPLDVLPTLDALIDYVPAHPLLFRRRDHSHAPDLLRELHHCRSTLCRAAASGARFRFHLGH